MSEWLSHYEDPQGNRHFPKALTMTLVFGVLFVAVGYVYDLGVRAGQRGALLTAYEVCRKVAPYKDGVGCR
jgi:hypothetical protein